MVAADGAGSMCRRAFRHAFISPNTEGANIEARQIRFCETTDDFEEADFALSIALKPDASHECGFDVGAKCLLVELSGGFRWIPEHTHYQRRVRCCFQGHRPKRMHIWQPHSFVQGRGPPLDHRHLSLIYCRVTPVYACMLYTCSITLV